MSALLDLPWESCILEPRPDRVLERRVQRESGWVGTTVSYFGRPEWTAIRMARLNRILRAPEHLSLHLANLVGLAVSQENSCRYCYASQRALMRGVGYSEAVIRKLEQALMTGEFEARERAAIDFARRMSRSDPLPGEDDLASLRDAGFEDLAIRELVAHIAIFVLFNRISTLVALPPEPMEELPDRWYVRLLAPVIVLRMRRMIRAGEPGGSIRPQSEGEPFAAVVAALESLPSAVDLQDTLRDCFSSQAIPTRSVGLLFAVVARALGCGKSEAEATRILVAEGLEREEIASVLAHLSGPGLSELERRAIPYARDTVWYGQAPPIQRRTRELADALSREELVEVVFAVSLANMVCRMGVITAARG